MPKQSKAWKGAEYQFRDVFIAAGINAERKSRAANWSEKDYEIHVYGLIGQEPQPEFLRCDSKYSASQPFRHHGLMEEIKFKYCKNKEDEPVLFTKNYQQHSGFITVRSEFFAECLASYLREKNGSRRI